jgi:hypothetical protein
MPTTDFAINGKTYAVSIDGCPEFRTGKDIILSNTETDIVFNQPWYKKGYTAERFLSDEEFAYLKTGLITSVKKIISDELGIDTEGFTLEKYHHFVNDNQDHYKVVSRTRDFFSVDFNFPIEEMILMFEKILGFSLTDIDPK